MAYLKGVNLSASSNIDGTAANFTSISGSSISGSFTGSFIGNIVGTASRATVANISNTALTASYIDGANVDGAVLTASFASTGDGTFSGSFSGSFTGDGSNLTGVTAAGTLSSSAQIASDISGAFGAPSASFSTRITAQETFSSSLDATFATEAELNASSSALTTAYTTADTSLSSSLAADIATNVSNITTNSSSAASDIAALQSDSASFSTRITSNDVDIAALVADSSSFSTRVTSNDVDIAALQSDSSSFSTRVTANESFSSSLSSTIISYTGSFSGDGSNLTGVVAAGTISSSAQIASDISGAFTADSASLAADITTNSASIATLDNTTVKLTGDQSIAGTKTFTGDISIQGTASINHLETIYETSSVIYSSGSTKFGDTLDDTHIRTGSLLITGSSYTINGEDIIITSALNASTSSLSSSLATGIASNSASLAANISTNTSNIIANSSSAATDIAALVADSASFSTRITSNDADISALQSDSSSFSTRITSNDADIAALQSDSSSFSTRITSNDADISALQSDSSSFSTRITSNDVDIAALQSDSSSFSTRVTDLETFSSSLDNTFATEAELNTATASLSSSLATDIATNSASIAAIDSFPYTGSAIISGSLTVTGSTEISGSVTAHSFNIDPTATGTPTLYSPTILNLSASDAVVVTSSPFRVASLTTTERGTFTAQDGDIIFNTTVGKYQVYSGSAWTNILQTEDKYDEITVTVVNDGGNKYAFDGVTAPKLSLNKGTTYRFDLSDSSNSNHPLAFRLPNDTSYTTGVTTVGTAGNTGAYVEFDVDFATSSSLKYYCTVHGNGMGNVIQLIDLYDLVATGSLQGTATTASYVAASNIDGTVTSASYAVTSSHAITASFAQNAGSVDTGSLLTTASATNNTITFTKGDSSTFDVTVATGSGGGGGSGDGFPFTGSAEITGSLSVIGGSISGDGSGLTNVSISSAATFTASFSNTSSFTTDHNFNTKNVLVQVYNTSDEIIIPASISTPTVNTVTATFTAPSSGRIVVGKAGHLIQTASLSEDTLVTASFTNSVSEAVVHNFDSLNVSVIVYDTNNTQIIPSGITLTDSNTATVTFAATSSGHIVVTKGGHIVSGSSGTNFNNLSLNPFTSGSGASITASGHLVPDTHEAYDLGSSTLRWRDLYLSGSTINLGGTEISADADGHVEFHTGSTRKKLIVDELIIGSNTSTQRRLNINNGRLRVQTDGGSEEEVDNAATASIAITASYVAASNIDGTVTSASYAITASYAENAGGGSGFPYTGSAGISGSLTVVGTTTSTTFVESSALRYKEDIKPLNSQLDKVLQLKPVSYTWSLTQDQHIGLVAEDVNELYPEFIGRNEQGEVEGIQYSKMVSVLIQSIQEQQQQINELKTQLNQK